MLPPCARLRRDHWEPDGSRTACAHADCGLPLRKFNRHHCRKCGKLFCRKCASGKLKCRLNALAEFDDRGVWRKVCRDCCREKERLRRRIGVEGNQSWQPERGHWEPNRARKKCADPACHVQLRICNRHHCRHCGKLFCGRCLDGTFQRKLNEHAGFDAQGVFCKVCEGCFKQQNGWFGTKDEDWISSNEGHSRDHFTMFAQFRSEEQTRVRALERFQSETPMTAEWRVKICQRLAAEAAQALADPKAGKAKLKSQEHWADKNRVHACSNFFCQKPFSAELWRHHCRVCGKLFCNACCPRTLDPSLFAPSKPTAPSGGGEAAEAATGSRKSVEEERCEESLAEDLKRCKLQQAIWASTAHPLSAALYRRVEGLATLISASVLDFAAAIERLEVTCASSRVPLPSELGPAVAAVLDVQNDLLAGFRVLERGFGAVLAWGPWTLVKLLGEGSAVVSSEVDNAGSDSYESTGTDAGPARDVKREGLFTWKDRVCVYTPLERGRCRVTAAQDLDTVNPGQVLYEGRAVTSVAEHKILVANLRRFYSAFWQGAYISHYKTLLHRAQIAVRSAEVHAQASSPSLPPFLRPNADTSLPLSSAPHPSPPDSTPSADAQTSTPTALVSDLASIPERRAVSSHHDPQPPIMEPGLPSPRELTTVEPAAAVTRAAINSSSFGNVLGMVLRCLQVSELAPTAVEVPSSTPQMLRSLSVRLKHVEAGPGSR